MGRSGLLRGFVSIAFHGFGLYAVSVVGDGNWEGLLSYLVGS